ncbi:MAG: hypothetical protein IAX21_04910 [Candidatus Bathyarchaeota archaeon]|nr:MAG: putative glycoside hydrolase [Candidatus Bathyarchaeum tardum]WNZ30192.1 MAG: hypothetical protein IAX21_04910 [Candidatus Bathyarchaeota archaeon]
MKIGVLTSKPEPIEGFDKTFYCVKSCTGRIKKPADNVFNIISCFGDNVTARKKPEWVAVSKQGKAVRRNKNHRFLWDVICPSGEEYKKQILDLVKNTLKADVTGIHLESIGFPRSEYCTCERCVKELKESNLEWTEWRAKTVTDFVAQVSKLVREKNKSFSVTLLPDPCFGKQRYGEDAQALAKYVDFFLVPIYDLAYSTTYWVETLALDFSKQLEKPLYIELYASNPGPKLKNLLSAIISVSNYANGIILATHDPYITKEIQGKLVTDSEVIKFLQKHKCEPIINIIENWKNNKIR